MDIDRLAIESEEISNKESEFVSIWYLSELVKWWEKGLLPARSNLDIEYYCSFLGAYEVATFFTDVPALVHGPSGCTESFNATRAYPGETKAHRPSAWSTALNHDDVVFGAYKKLQDAIVELDKQVSPKLITVLTNCCADIIGEDLKGAIATVKSIVTADIVQLETGGCSGDGFRKGADLVFRALFDYVASNSKKTIHKSAGPSINLFTKRLSGRPAELREVQELKRLLGKLGIEINSIIRLGSTYDDLMSIPCATANASLCYVFGDDPMKALQERFNQPFAAATYPIGLKGTINWLTRIAELVDIDASILEKDEEIQKYQEKIDCWRKKYSGRRAFIWMPGEKGLAMCRFVTELGMKPYLFAMSYQTVAEQINTIRLFLDEGYDIPAVLSGKEVIMREFQNSSQNDKPLLFMPRKFWAGELPTATVNFFGDQMLGLAGIDFLLEAMDKAVKEAGKKDYALFNRYIENRIPAKQWNISGPAFDGADKYLRRKLQILRRRQVRSNRQN